MPKHDDPEIITELRALGVITEYAAGSDKGEYHGPCPLRTPSGDGELCGGDDRFRINPFKPGWQHGYYACRVCGRYGNLNQLRRLLGGGQASSANWTNRRSGGRTSQAAGGAQESPTKEWQDKIGKVIAELLQPFLRRYPYISRGISNNSVEENKLFLIDKPRKIKVQNKDIVISPGLGIPIYRAGQLYGLKIRTFSGKPKYRLVSGSKVIPLILLVRSKQLAAPVIVVESELDAIIIHQMAGDLVHAIALGSAANKPDAYTREFLRHATKIIVCLDYDAAGVKAQKWWRDNYPSARFIFSPTGKDVGDYHLGGHNVQDWIERVVFTESCISAVEQRPQPHFQAFVVDSGDMAEQVITSLRDSKDPIAFTTKTQLPDGPSKDPGLSMPKAIALANDNYAFTFDLERIPREALAKLNGARLITYDSVEQACLLRSIGLGNCEVDCVDLQFNAMNNLRWSLEQISQFRLGYGVEISDARFGVDEYGPAELQAMAKEAFAIGENFRVQKKKLQQNGLERLYRLMVGAVSAAADIRGFGMPFDWEAHHRRSQAWSHQIEMAQEGDGSLGSFIHLHKVWGPSFCRFRSPRSGRIHPMVQIAGTLTGRFTISDPAIQTLPKGEQTRSLVAASEGCVLVGGDLSQAELRVASMVANDPEMIAAFRNNVDIHRLSAAAKLGVPIEEVTDPQRQAAKTENFRLLNSNQGALGIIKAFPGLRAWMAKQGRPHVKGDLAWQVRTPMGRRILRDFSESGAQWSRCRINYPIQGGAAEVMLAALGRLPPYLSGLSAKVVNIIHDEILLEVAEADAPAAAKALEQAMVDGFLEMFPDAPVEGLVTATIGKTWNDLK